MGKLDIRISQISYSMHVNEGKLMCENVNTPAETIWQGVKETLQY